MISVLKDYSLSLIKKVQYLKYYVNIENSVERKGLWQMLAEGEIVAKYDTRQLIDAIEKNGWRKAVGTLYRPKKGTGAYKNPYIHPSSDEVGMACALGQGFLNLGIQPKDMYSYQGHLPIGLTEKIFKMNDQQHKPVAEIGRALKETEWYTKPVKF